MMYMRRRLKREDGTTAINFWGEEIWGWMISPLWFWDVD